MRYQDKTFSLPVSSRKVTQRKWNKIFGTKQPVITVSSGAAPGTTLAPYERAEQELEKMRQE